MDRAELVEACNQAANLYRVLAEDAETRRTSRKLRAAAVALGEVAAPLPPPPAPAPAPVDDDLLMVVSSLIGLSDRAPGGGWLVDDETMERLKRAHTPHHLAALRRRRDKETATRAD